MKPAQYIKLKYGEDPLIYGMIDGDPHQYIESFQATPFPSAGPLRTYTLGQLELFKEDHDLRLEVDSTVYHLYDKSAMVEVECYRINRKKLKCQELDGSRLLDVSGTCDTVEGKESVMQGLML